MGPQQRARLTSAARRGAAAGPQGKIVSWLKSPGDKVAKGEPIVVVESDKADMDVESFNDGILGAIMVQVGFGGGGRVI
jgi:biotin carboxyl carrier protein